MVGKKSIRGYLLLSSSFMVIVVVGALLLLYAVLITVYQYNEQNGDVSDQELRSGRAAAVLLEDWLGAGDASAASAAALGDGLAALDYSVCVLYGGEEIFCTGEDLEEPNADMARYFVPDGQVHMYFSDGVTILTVSNGEGGAQVYALRYGEEALTGVSHLLVFYIIAGLIFILILTVSSYVFTRRLTLHIMRPLDRLISASESVRRGDYSHRIEYRGDWEFENVCASFNDMQDQIRENERRAVAYEKARTDVVAGISHDLRTPLTAIRGTIKGMRDGVAKTPELQKKFLDTAYHRTLEMERLLEQLFYFSKMETGNMPLYMETVEWGAFLDGYMDKLRRDTASLAADFGLENEAGEVCSLLDRREIERALDNIVVNSRKYARAEHLTVSFRLTRDDGRVFLRIADNGCGVPEEKLPFIFDKFYRADESRTRPEGNGLGLHIVKYLAEAMHGSVEAANDGGLQITLTFPIAEEGQADE